MTKTDVPSAEERLSDIREELPEDHVLDDVLKLLESRSADRIEEATYQAVAELAEYWVENLDSASRVGSDIADVISQLKAVQVEYHRSRKKSQDYDTST